MSFIEFWRGGEAKFAISTLRYPEEIWFQPVNDRLDLIKQFLTVRKGKQINEERRGKLLYKS